MNGLANVPQQTSDAIPLPPRAPCAAPPGYFRCSLIAAVLDCSRQTVAFRARREHWSSFSIKNRVDFQPPPEIAARCQALLPAPPNPEAPAPTFASIDDIKDRQGRKNLLFRLAAVAFYKASLRGLSSITKAQALSRAVGFVVPAFPISESTLEKLVRAYDLHGLDGLIGKRAWQRKEAS